MAEKKRTGLLIATGCGLLLCIPLCLGTVGGAGGLFYWLGVSDEGYSSWDKSEHHDFDRTATAVDDRVVADQATDNDLEPEEMDEGFDSGLFGDDDGEADLGDEAELTDPRVTVDDAPSPVTTTRRQPTAPVEEADLLDEEDDLAFDDEEDFDDIAAEIAALDSLDDPDDEPSKRKKKSPPSDKPGTIKVSGDVDRASVIGSDGVYRSPGKFDPGTYRLEITLDDGTVVTKTVKLKGGQTLKFKCDVDAGDCSR